MGDRSLQDLLGDARQGIAKYVLDRHFGALAPLAQAA